ncbi:globin-coupled sensor protein [Bacillaceae bacterium]
MLQTLKPWKNKNSHSRAERLSKVHEEKATVEIHADEELKKQMALIDLTEEDLRIIQSLQPFFADHLDEIASFFYQKIFEVPHLKQIIETNSSLERLKNTLRQHLFEMLSGRIDNEYIARRNRVARIHVKIGLAPHWYIAAFQILHDAFFRLLNEHFANKDEIARGWKAICKMLNLEQQLVLKEYEQEKLQQLEKQYQVKEELKKKIAAVSEELAALTEQTNASVQQVAANANEVRNAVRHSAEKSRAAQQIARSGQDTLEKLESQINAIHQKTDEMVKLVHKLEESSQQTKKIVTIVQQIAKQTNLLSLNAAIEASRAGEHGRGFAVVANEVRKLAEQSTNSVEQIEELIRTSIDLIFDVVQTIAAMQKNVERGKQESSNTRAKLGEIFATMDGHMEQINRVEKDINHLVQVIEEICAATEKVSSTAESLNQETMKI